MPSKHRSRRQTPSETQDSSSDQSSYEASRRRRHASARDAKQSSRSTRTPVKGSTKQTAEATEVDPLLQSLRGGNSSHYLLRGAVQNNANKQQQLQRRKSNLTSPSAQAAAASTATPPSAATKRSGGGENGQSSTTLDSKTVSRVEEWWDSVNEASNPALADATKKRKKDTNDISKGNDKDAPASPDTKSPGRNIDNDANKDSDDGGDGGRRKSSSRRDKKKEKRQSLVAAGEADAAKRRSRDAKKALNLPSDQQQKQQSPPNIGGGGGADGGGGPTAPLPPGVGGSGWGGGGGQEVTSLSWENRSVVGVMYKPNSMWSALVSPQFWSRAEWSFRTTFLIIVPAFAIALAPNTASAFALPSLLVDMALSGSSMYLGECIVEMIEALKGAALATGFMATTIAINESTSIDITKDKYMFLIFVTIQCTLIGVFASYGVMKYGSYFGIIYMLQYYRDSEESRYLFLWQFFYHLAIGFCFAFPAFFFPRRHFAIKKARTKIGITGNTISIAVQGICASFWSPNSQQREVNLLKIRSMRSTAKTLLGSISNLLGIASTEPVGRYEVLRSESRRALLKTLADIVHSWSLVIDLVAANPVVTDTPTCMMFGSRISEPLGVLASSFDALLLKIMNGENIITKREVSQFREIREQFEEAVSLAREDLVLWNEFYEPEAADIYLGYFLFSLNQATELVEKFEEPSSDLPNIFWEMLVSPYYWIVGSLNNIRYVLVSLLHGRMPRILKESIKLTLGIVLATAVQIYDNKPDPLSGAALIPWAYQRTGAATFNYLTLRLLGTVIGSVMCFIGNDLAGGELGYVIISFSVVCFIGAFVRSSSSYTTMGTNMLWSASSISSQYTNRLASVTRVQQNVLAMMINAIVCSILWPVHSRQRIKLSLDMSLRSFRDSTSDLLDGFADRDNNEVVRESVGEYHASFMKHVGAMAAYIPAAVKEPSLVGAPFPDEQWKQVVTSLQNLGVIIAMMKHAHRTIHTTAKRPEKKMRKKKKKSVENDDTGGNDGDAEMGSPSPQGTAAAGSPNAKPSMGPPTKTTTTSASPNATKTNFNPSLPGGTAASPPRGAQSQGRGGGDINEEEMAELSSFTNNPKGSEKRFQLDSTVANMSDTVVTRREPAARPTLPSEPSVHDTHPNLQKSRERPHDPFVIQDDDDFGEASYRGEASQSGALFGADETEIGSPLPRKGNATATEASPAKESKNKATEEDANVDDDGDEMETDTDFEDDTPESLHWVMIDAVDATARDVGRIVFATVDLYLLLVGEVTVVPLSHLVRLRVNLMLNQSAVEEMYFRSLETIRMITEEILEEEEAADGMSDTQHQHSQHNYRNHPNNNGSASAGDEGGYGMGGELGSSMVGEADSRSMQESQNGYDDTHSVGWGSEGVSVTGAIGEQPIAAWGHTTTDNVPPSPPRGYPRRRYSLSSGRIVNTYGSVDSMSQAGGGGYTTTTGRGRHGTPTTLSSSFDGGAVSHHQPNVNSNLVPVGSVNSALCGPEDSSSIKRGGGGAFIASTDYTSSSNNATKSQVSARASRASSQQPYHSRQPSANEPTVMPGSYNPVTGQLLRRHSIGLGGSPTTASAPPAASSIPASPHRHHSHHSRRHSISGGSTSYNGVLPRTVTAGGGNDENGVSGQATTQQEEGEDGEYDDGDAPPKWSLSNEAVHAVEALLFGMRAIVSEIGGLERALLELRQVEEVGEKL